MLYLPVGSKVDGNTYRTKPEIMTTSKTQTERIEVGFRHKVGVYSSMHLTMMVSRYMRQNQTQHLGSTSNRKCNICLTISTGHPTHPKKGLGNNLLLKIFQKKLLGVERNTKIVRTLDTSETL